jgi:hypothetical protein
MWMTLNSVNQGHAQYVHREIPTVSHSIYIASQNKFSGLFGT